MADRQTVIVFVLYPGVTQLDFTGPHEVFASLPDADVILASTEGGSIEATGGMTFVGVRRLADIPACDVLCVPGGQGSTDHAIHDDILLAEIRRLAATARFVTSVCTGSLVLGAAGLLRGFDELTIEPIASGADAAPGIVLFRQGVARSEAHQFADRIFDVPRVNLRNDL